jgi:hypothetical protein
VCKEWKRTKGRFPKVNKKDKEEWSLYKWLHECKPGGRNWTQARWEKLNEAFGEGWEKECFPYLGTGGWVFQAGNQPIREEGRGPVGRDPGGREAVQADPRQVPEGQRWRCGRDEAVHWLQDNMDTTSGIYTPERANKLVLAFGDRWQSECFPKSIWAW